MLRRHRGFPVTGTEPTLVALGAVLDAEALETACEDARRHDDAADYEGDNEKWSVPGRLGYRIVFATWAKVDRHPDLLVRELTTSLAG